MQGGWPAWTQRLLLGHRSGAVLRELLSAGLRPGADVAAGLEAARAACGAGSTECLRLVVEACGAEQVAAMDGRELLLVVLGNRDRIRGMPVTTRAPVLPAVVAVADVSPRVRRQGAGVG